MFLIAVHLSLFEIGILLAGAIVLGLTIHFFIVSRRSLQETLEKTQQKNSLRPHLYMAPAVARVATKQAQPVSSAVESVGAPVIQQVKKTTTFKEDSVEDLKETVLQQQKLLNGFLRQVEMLEHEGREELELRNKHLESELQNLESQLDRKAIELDEMRQKASVAERMAAKIEEVYQEFDQLQAKMETLEKQANRANNLAIELEDTRQAYEQVHKDLLRKNEKLEEAFRENQQLQHQFNSLEDKLAEANLQRQQLQKKVQFLQDLNADLQSISDTNKKLQTELRRVGELESMLNMIAEERDYLLRKQSNR
jgi:chromosome segregation ATPase